MTASIPSPASTASPDPWNRDVEGGADWIYPRRTEDGRFHFDGFVPGSYVLALGTPWHEEIEIEGVNALRGEITRDPRLDPIDLRGRVRRLRLETVDESGRSVRATVWVRYRDGSMTLLGTSGETLGLLRSEEVAGIAVDAKGYPRRNLSLVECARRVVTREE